MADSISFEIEGVNSLNAKLEEVSSDVKFKGGRFALRKAANLVRERVKDNARRLDDPETANNIADNIAVRWDSKKFRATGDLHFHVGVRGGARSRQENLQNPGGDTFYWRYLEFGTENIPAVPFIRPALAESTNAATQEFVTHYGKAIDRAIKRAAKNGGG
ncbi:HK97-gp10 family putative phage morphogenesis protein [Kushneria sp. Sum13]|uniref:HK97-gp10 family putative phage morphogenesis protein n=1 Tax=Kushneria sp. Sum13 TaxID=3459196 RepID=UPI0040461B47